MFSLSGHLGDQTAALVDGQLEPAAEERAWRHVLACPGCRETVEQQAAAKQLLGGLGPTPSAPRSWLDPAALSAWEQVAAVEREAALGRRRHLVAGGVVAASLASVALVLATSAAPLGEDVVPAPASIRGATPTTAAPDAPRPTERAAPGERVGTSSGGETSHALWRHGSRW